MVCPCQILYNDNYMKKQIFIAVLIIVILGGLSALAVHKYQTRPVVHTETLSQAQAERDAALKQVALHDAVNKANESSLNQTNTDLKTKLASVCASLKTTRVTNLACQ